MALLKIGNSEVNYLQNLGSNAQNNNMYFGDSSLKKQEPTAVQKAFETTGYVIEIGGDFISSWFSWGENVLENFSFYLIMIAVILSLVLSLYILCRCYCHRNSRNLSTKNLTDIFTIMTAKNSADQPSSFPALSASTKF